MSPPSKFVELVSAALAGIPDGQPVVMLNLLRYRAAALKDSRLVATLPAES